MGGNRKCSSATLAGKKSSAKGASSSSSMMSRVPLPHVRPRPLPRPLPVKLRSASKAEIHHCRIRTFSLSLSLSLSLCRAIQRVLRIWITSNLYIVEELPSWHLSLKLEVRLPPLRRVTGEGAGSGRSITCIGKPSQPVCAMSASEVQGELWRHGAQADQQKKALEWKQLLAATWAKARPYRVSNG